jgi:hypothetical protein
MSVDAVPFHQADAAGLNFRAVLAVRAVQCLNGVAGTTDAAGCPNVPADFRQRSKLLWPRNKCSI